MRVRTHKTSADWITTSPTKELDNISDIATAEIARFLSQAVRSPHLSVLSGLGTSLCVKPVDGRSAPTMAVLSQLVAKAFDELDKAAPLAGGDSRWNAFKSLARVTDDEPNLEELLSKAKIASDFLGGDQSRQAEELLLLAERVICNAVNFVSTQTDLEFHEAFLRRIARRSARRSRVKLFTTNYDRCFEVAAARSGCIVIDGFGFNANSTFNPDQFNYDVVRRNSDERTDFIENLFHLFKMHGSINWEEEETTGQVVKRPNAKKPILIYPRSTKYEMAFSRPYVDMMANFQAVLRSSGIVLLVIGFGFNDKHIAEPIVSAIRSNLSMSLIVIDPLLSKKCDRSSMDVNPYLANLVSLVDNGDGRIALIEGRFEEIVPLIPDMVAETDLERHQDRV